MQIVQVLTSSSQPFVSRLAGADLPRRNNPHHLVLNKRAATRKRRVSMPLQAHWPASFPWGDKRGDKHLVSDVSCPLTRRCRVAAPHPH